MNAIIFVKSEVETEEQPYIAAFFVPQYEKCAFLFFNLKLYMSNYHRNDIT